MQRYECLGDYIVLLLKITHSLKTELKKKKNEENIMDFTNSDFIKL